MQKENPLCCIQVLAANVRRYRRLAGLTQVDLAASIGIIRTHLSLIETGKTNPTATTIGALAIALGVGVANLLTE